MYNPTNELLIEATTPRPCVELGSIRDRPNAGGAGDLVGFLHAGRISTQTRAHLIVAGGVDGVSGC